MFRILGRNSPQAARLSRSNAANFGTCGKVRRLDGEKRNGTNSKLILQIGSSLRQASHRGRIRCACIGVQDNLFPICLLASDSESTLSHQIASITAYRTPPSVHSWLVEAQTRAASALGVGSWWPEGAELRLIHSLLLPSSVASATASRTCSDHTL